MARDKNKYRITFTFEGEIEAEDVDSVKDALEEIQNTRDNITGWGKVTMDKVEIFREEGD